jgi:hypothetical protein
MKQLVKNLVYLSAAYLALRSLIEVYFREAKRPVMATKAIRDIVYDTLRQVSMFASIDQGGTLVKSAKDKE